MERENGDSQSATNSSNSSAMRQYDIGGREYMVKSVFIGTQDVKSALLKLAERKAIKEMGLDTPVA